MAGVGAVGFTPGDAQRVAAATRYVEGLSRGGGSGRNKTNYPWNPGTRAATTTGTISALSGTTPGSGNATLYDFNGTTLSSGDAVTVYNMGASIASGRKILVSYVQSYWFVVVDAC